MGEVSLPFNFKPRHYQLPILRAMDEGATRGVAVWHRRSGKEKTFLNYTAKRSFQRVGSYYYFFPTYKQGKKALWEGMDRDGFRFMDHFPDEIVASRNETEMKIKLRNGSIFQILGTENIDSVMSTNPIGCVFAEYSLQDPRAWDYIRPILKENGGWAIFDYTPRGKNHGYELYEMAKRLMEEGDPRWFVSRLTVKDTGALSDADIEAERREGMSEDMIQQEYFCSFAGVQQGSIFGKQMQEAQNEGRVCSVPWQRDAAVDTWWDIGTGDATAIWFTQTIGREIHVIDYTEESGVGPEFFARKLFQEMPYTYGTHNGPHDLENRSFAANAKSTKEVAEGLGIKFNVVEKLDKTSQLNAARAFIPRCWFDTKKTERGRSALMNYHYTYDEKRKVFSSEPYHDWSSNGADAFQYLSVGHKVSVAKRREAASAPRPMQVSTSNTGWLGV